MKIIICDDEMVFVKKMRDEIERVCAILAVGQYEIKEYIAAEELLSNEASEDFYIFFLDIDMPIISGFELAQKISEKYNNYSLVFVSSKNELVFQSFDYNPVSFIRKSHLREELYKIMKKILSEEIKQKRNLLLERDNSIVSVKLSEIIYISNDKNYINYYTQKGVYRARQSMKEVEVELQKAGFIRIHKSYLINYMYIEGMPKDFVELSNGTKLSVSKKRYEDILEQWYKILGGI